LLKSGKKAREAVATSVKIALTPFRALLEDFVADNLSIVWFWREVVINIRQAEGCSA
jgi:hypothetical protein